MDRRTSEPEHVSSHHSEATTHEDNPSQISALPAELIENICTLAVSPHSDYVESPWRDLVSLTAVCRAWRTILLACPPFWTSFSFLIPPVLADLHLPEMMQRAEGQPVTVRLNFHSRYSNGYMISPNIAKRILAPGRLKELHLRGSSTQLLNQVSSETYPVLESLQLCDYNKSSIPASILTSRKTALRRLVLDTCQVVSWNEGHTPLTRICVLERLHTLHLRNLQPVMSWEQIFEILSSVPQLRDLLLDTVTPEELPTNEPVLLSGNTMLSLPHLQRFSVGSKLHTCIYLLNVLPLTSDVEIEININNSHTSFKNRLEDCEELFRTYGLLPSEVVSPLDYPRAFIGSLPESKSEPCTHLFLDRERPRVQSAGSEHTTGSALRATTTDSDVPDLESALEFGFYAPSLRALLAKVIISGLRYLTLATPYWACARPGPENWKSFFKRHELVTTLGIQGNIRGVVQALTPSPESTITASAEPSPPLASTADIVLPHLTSLTITRIIFDHTSFHDCRNFKALLTMLTQRKSRNVPIRKLEFKSCSHMDGPEGMPEYLRGILGDGLEVDWEGERGRSMHPFCQCALPASMDIY